MDHVTETTIRNWYGHKTARWAVDRSELVWPSGRLLRLVSRATSVRIRLDSPFSSKVVVCGHCLVTLSRTVNEAFKWLSSLPILNAGVYLVTLSLTVNEALKCLSLLPILMHKSFWWWQCSDRYIISLSPHLHTPISPSLISLMVSVDVKHHVYLRGQSIRSKLA